MKNVPGKMCGRPDKASAASTTCRAPRHRGHAVGASIWACAVIIVSIVVDVLRARLLYRTAKETTSQALEADALHFDSDMWSSLAVLVGLGGVALGYAWADAAAALIVAVFI